MGKHLRAGGAPTPDLAAKAELIVEGTSKVTLTTETIPPTTQKIMPTLWQARDWRRGGSRKELAGGLNHSGY